MLKKDGESIPFTRLQAIVTTIVAVIGLIYVVLPAHDSALLKDADTRARLNALEISSKAQTQPQSTVIKIDPEQWKVISVMASQMNKIDTWISYSPGGIKDSERKKK